MRKTLLVIMTMLFAFAITSCQMNTDDTTVPYVPTTEATYTITTTYDNTNGSVKVTNASGEVITSAKAGEKVTLTITPNSGYKFVTTINGSDMGFNDNKENNYEVTMPASNVTITVEFVATTNNGNGGTPSTPTTDNSSAAYSITVPTLSNGTITVTNKNGNKVFKCGDGSTLPGADAGDKIEIEIVPPSEETYYEYENKLIDNSKVTDLKKDSEANGTIKYSFTMPSGSVTINRVTFDPKDGYKVSTTYSSVTGKPYHYDGSKWAGRDSKYYYPGETVYIAYKEQADSKQLTYKVTVGNITVNQTSAPKEIIVIK